MTTRWECEAYCTCGTRKGLFRQSASGTWVRYQTHAQEMAQLRRLLERYTFAYPAFRMKPVGAPGSPARIESERLMALEESAQEAIKGLACDDPNCADGYVPSMPDGEPQPCPKCHPEAYP